MSDLSGIVGAFHLTWYFRLWLWLTATKVVTMDKVGSSTHILTFYYARNGRMYLTKIREVNPNA